MQDHSQASSPRRSLARAMATLADILAVGGHLLVRQVLGTPLLQDLFRASRWDYVFTLKDRKDVDRLNYRLSVFFENDVLAAVEGAETLPTETEFVRVLGDQKDYKPRNLQADPDKLQGFAEKNRPPESKLPEQPTTPGSTSFPPLPQ